MISESALFRKYKKYIKNHKHTFFVSCPIGTENRLKKELIRNNHTLSLEVMGGIEVIGTIEEMYSLNMSLTASRVLLRIDKIKALSYPELFNKVSKIKWDAFLGNTKNIKTNITSVKSKLRHTDNISKTIIDGINQFYKQHNQTVEHDKESNLAIFIRAEEDVFTISIDTTGNHLHKRGYKRYSSDAPIRENLSSAIIADAPFDNHETVIDPCCGSGTLLFEHAILASNINSSRMRNFAFEHLYFFNKNLYLRNTKSEYKKNTKYFGFDILQKNIDTSEYNQKEIYKYIKPDITFIQKDSTKLANEFGSKGLIISNLPYGKRINPTTTNHFYNMFGKNLSKEFAGWDCIFITTSQHRNALPVKVTKTKSIKNSNIPVIVLYGSIF